MCSKLRSADLKPNPRSARVREEKITTTPFLTGLLGILEHLGYRELRPEDTERSAGERRPTEEVNGRYGTRDETG